MRPKRGSTKTYLMLILLLLVPLRSALGQEGPINCTELRPDLCPLEDRLYETYIWYDAGKTYLRLSNSIANVGMWQLLIEPSGPVNQQTGKRPARQKIICTTVDDDDIYYVTYRYYPVGEFEYHDADCHLHLHLGRIAEYGLREYAGLSEPPGSPGPTGDKVGFCLLDREPYECTSCCGLVQGTSPSGPVFGVCPEDINSSFTEGISVGWQDTYDYFLDDQWIDISNVVPGRYWLQSVADPDHLVRQSSIGNDTARIPIFIAYKDLYEPNDTRDQVNSMAIGGVYSSNLSACQTTIDSLSIHREYIQEPTFPCIGDAPGDVDYFKIYLADAGGPGHNVRIVFGDSSNTAFKDGNLDMELLDASGGLVELANSTDDNEVIELENKPAGIYYLKVYGRIAAIPPSGLVRPNSNYYYRLELSLPAPACGDVNGDGQINQADITMLANFCNGSGALACPDQADVDGICGLNCNPGGDLDYLIAYVFSGGPNPNCNCQP